MNREQATHRAVFGLCLVLGLLVIWASPQPPMVDLPQHAGQLRLLRDLLLGQCAWSELLEINPWTPYLIGFGIALPFSLVLPMGMSLQLVLSLAFLAFVHACVLLRRALGAPAALDWLFLLSFFGFAFRWGFLTFEVAAPLGLYFVLLCLQQVRAPTRGRALALCLLGTAVLLAHALVFLFVLGIGLLLVAQQTGDLRRWHHWRDGLRRAWPLLALVLLCGVYSVLRAQADARYGVAPTAQSISWHFGIRHEILYYSFGTRWHPVFALVCATALLVPWLAGYRMPLQVRRAALAPLAVVLAILLFVPSFALEIAMLYQRFALFLLPAYALAFVRPASASAPPRWAGAALAAAAVLLLATNAAWSWRFGREAADFRQVVAQLEPGQRALSLVLDGFSRVTPDLGPYTHFASWYQADQGGLVDMNFAMAPPQIVRFRPGRVPPVPLNLSWFPERFDWQRNAGDSYRYFFLRRAPGQAAPDFAGSRCRPRLHVQHGSWSVYERVDACGPA